MIPRLQPLLTPASVAIVGASSTPGKYGHTVVRYLQQAGFKGRIYPINQDGGLHNGLQYYRSLKDVPEQIDCAFTVIPAAATPDVVRQGADAGVRAMILGASGFAEMGSDTGRKRQAEIADTARAAGMILLGPNTNGIWNAHHGLALGYNTSHGEPMRPGPVSIAAHSGALFDSFIPRLAAFGGGFAKLVPLGNEATLDMLDVLEALVEDPQTQVIGLIMEAIRDGARFRDLVARAHGLEKPVFVLKLGRSAAGATAAIAHSSRLAGSYRAYEALLRYCGVPIVRSIETLAAVCTLACDKRAFGLKGDTRLIGVSGSGGGCSLMADHAAERGIALAGDGAGAWTGATAEVIAGFPGIGLVRNPIDGGNLHGWDKLPSLLAAMDKDGLNGPLAAFAHRLPTLAGDMAQFMPIFERKRRTGAPTVAVSPGGMRAEMQARCTAEGVPVFSDLAACFDSLKALDEANAGMVVRPSAASGASAVLRLDDAKVHDVRDQLEPVGHTSFLSEVDSARILKLAGVPMVELRIVDNAEEAKWLAAELRYPVVLKAIAPGIAHKNDAGLVEVAISDGVELENAFHRLAGRCASLGLSAVGVRFILQPHITSRAELILGTTYEPGLGHFLIAGLGGINAEQLDSVELFATPTSRDVIVQQLAHGRLGPLLQRLSGKGRTDTISDIAAALYALQTLVLALPDAIESIDCNPVLVGEAGCVAVDALIVPRSKT